MRTVTKKALDPQLLKGLLFVSVCCFQLFVSVLLSALCQCVAFSGSIFTGLAGSKLLLIRLNLLLPIASKGFNLKSTPLLLLFLLASDIAKCGFVRENEIVD